MTPESDWNYIIGVDGSDNSILQVVTHDIDATNPWIQSPQAIQIRVPMYQDPTWKEWYHKYVDENGNEAFAAQTPPLPTRGAMIFVLRKLSPEMKTLVPYGSTCLRISMFPFWQERAIAPEVLATEDTY